MATQQRGEANEKHQKLDELEGRPEESRQEATNKDITKAVKDSEIVTEIWQRILLERDSEFDRKLRESGELLETLNSMIRARDRALDEALLSEARLFLLQCSFTAFRRA